MHDQPGAEQLGTIPTSQLSDIAGGVLPPGDRVVRPSGSHGTPPSRPRITTLPLCPYPHGEDPGFTGPGLPGPDPDPYFERGGGGLIGDNRPRGV
jgi:hypothetical protein